MWLSTHGPVVGFAALRLLEPEVGHHARASDHRSRHEAPEGALQSRGQDENEAGDHVIHNAPRGWEAQAIVTCPDRSR